MLFIFAAMKIYSNILETIGDTPIVKLNSITKDVPGDVYVKIETTNPGNSIKDRMALKMIEDAEADGRLKPGGTIIECTSGNTGMGLAIAAAVKGYKCIFTTNDKQSKEKMDALRAFGAEVIVCPTAVSADDPRSYYSVARDKSEEIANSVWMNQYDNLSNRKAHYEQTGPEIWEQMGEELTHVVVGVGTGGTISGVGKFLKEKNPNIKIWGIDTYGSVFKKYHETGEFDENEIYPYITEGIGEDIIPKNVDFSVIDYFEKVTDKDAALMTRRIVREEGIFAGNSAGSALAGVLQLKDRLKEGDKVLVIFHDHGTRYLAKIFNDDWMRERGFISDGQQLLTVKHILLKKQNSDFITIGKNQTIGDAVELFKDKDISQIPVVNEGGTIVGSLSEKSVLQALIQGSHQLSSKIEEYMGPTFPHVQLSDSAEQVSALINRENSAVFVDDAQGNKHIITQYDLIQSIAVS